jgi:hypothetical protein
MAEMRRNALPILDSLGVDLVLTGHSHSYERSMLLRRHYGLSGTLADSMKVDAGDGQPSGDGAYEKPSAGQAPFEGAVYVVAGSSAQTSGGTLNHPIMISSQNVAGSLVFDVEGQQLDCRFLNSAGVVTDDFTIVKGTNVGVTPSGPGKGLLISSASPNPFRDEVDLSFTIPREGRVRLAIYGADGRRVASLLERVLPGGTHHWQWNGRDAAGRHVAPGAYFAVLDLEGHKRAWRLACVR